MEKFSFKEDNIFELCKLPEEWRFLELFRQFFFQLNLKDFADKPNLKPASKTKEKIIKLYKKNYSKLIEEEYFEKEYEEIHQFFYNQNSNLKFSIINNLMDLYLGPLGFKNSGIIYDINDFEEIYIVSNKQPMRNREYVYGSIKSKISGWNAWMFLNGDKFIQDSLTSKYIYLISTNHFKLETALQDLFEKKRKFEENKTGRFLKRLFVSNSFWFHEDLNKFYNNFKSIIINDYSKIGAANIFLEDLK